MQGSAASAATAQTRRQGTTVERQRLRLDLGLFLQGVDEARRHALGIDQLSGSPAYWTTVRMRWPSWGKRLSISAAVRGLGPPPQRRDDPDPEDRQRHDAARRRARPPARPRAAPAGNRPPRERPGRAPRPGTTSPGPAGPGTAGATPRRVRSERGTQVPGVRRSRGSWAFLSLSGQAAVRLARKFSDQQQADQRQGQPGPDLVAPQAIVGRPARARRRESWRCRLGRRKPKRSANSWACSARSPTRTGRR